MGLSYLEINNYPADQIKIEAKINNKRYEDALKNLNDINKNENMLTNLEYMRDTIRKNLENGKLKEDDWTYRHLCAVVEEATTIQIKRCKNYHDAIDFYEMCTNFDDIIKRVNPSE